MLRRFRCNYRGCLIVFNVLKAAWLRHFPCCAYIDGPVGPVGPAAGSPRLRGVLGQDPAGDGDFPPPDHDGAACGQRRGLRQGGAVRPGLSDGDPGLSVVTEIRRDNRRCPMRDSACLCFFSSENPSAFCCGWGGAVSAGPWPRSGGCAPG